MSRGDAFWSFFVWLFIAAVGAVVGALMAGAAVLAEFLICGDRADCGPHSFWVLAPERAFWLLAAGAGLIAVVAAVLAIGSLLLALFPGRRT